MPDFVLFLIFTCQAVTGSTLLDLKTNKITQYQQPYGFRKDERTKGKKVIITPYLNKAGHCA